MIDIASRAPNGVKIPETRATRESIKARFWRNVHELRTKFKVHSASILKYKPTQQFQSDAVQETVSLTCDAWQASNRNAYLAITGHWIEEVGPSDWQLCSALLGFTEINKAHNGVNLGRALYKITKCYHIEEKVRHIPSPSCK